MLTKYGDWRELGFADEQKDTKDGTVEAWGRSSSNPIGGWYGLKKGLRGRFGTYVPPLMEALGLAEVEHNARGNIQRSRITLRLNIQLDSSCPTRTLSPLILPARASHLSDIRSSVTHKAWTAFGPHRMARRSPGLKIRLETCFPLPLR